MPVVVVWMVTYNHEHYIRKAIESVMMQRTTFDFKLLIGEDDSKDDTRKICVELKDKYPDRIELFLNKINIGSFANGIAMYRKCFESEAKYVALLEGDDYWIDENKLQKQVDFIEKHHVCSMVFHKVNKFENDRIVDIKYPELSAICDVGDFLQKGGMMIHTSSILFKRRLLDISDEFYKAVVGDKYLILNLGEKGKFGFIPEYMSVYRQHEGGIWSPNEHKTEYRSNYLLGYFSMLENFNARTSEKYSEAVNFRMDWEAYAHIKKHIGTEQYPKIYSLFKPYISWKSTAKLVILRVMKLFA